MNNRSPDPPAGFSNLRGSDDAGLAQPRRATCGILAVHALVRDHPAAVDGPLRFRPRRLGEVESLEVFPGRAWSRLESIRPPLPQGFVKERITMASMKRKPAQRELDRAWASERSGEGLSPTEISRLSREDVDPDEFPILRPKDCKGTPGEVATSVDAARRDRQAAISAERSRRKSIADLSVEQVRLDVRTVRRRTIAAGEENYRPILERALVELQRLAFFDLRDVADWGSEGSELRDSNELGEDVAAAVSSVTSKTTTTTSADGSTHVVFDTKIDTHSKPRALQQLLQHLVGVKVNVTLGPAVDADAYAAGMLRNLEGDPEEEEGGS